MLPFHFIVESYFKSIQEAFLDYVTYRMGYEEKIESGDFIYDPNKQRITFYIRLINGERFEESYSVKEFLFGQNVVFDDYVKAGSEVSSARGVATVLVDGLRLEAQLAS